MTEASQSSPPKRQSLVTWLTIVLAAALGSRLAMFLLYQPISYSDTASYRRLAGTVLNGFTKYDGTRTPGYPVFLALLGSDQTVWIVQLFLGVITTLLLFYLGWKLTGRPWFGGMVALLHTLSLEQLFFESSLLTESLTAFLLVLCMLGVYLWLRGSGSRLGLSFFLGLVSALSLLVRPLFIYLPFYLLLFLWLVMRRNATSPMSQDQPADTKSSQPSLIHPSLLRIGIAFFIPVILLLGGWVAFIHSQFGEWSLTTMNGYHLIQHTGAFFEYVPDQYAALRDTYLRYRDAHMAEYGTQANTIWEAIPEMSQVSGYNFYELSNVLQRISIQLILRHPFLYLKGVISGWWMFWRTAVYWTPSAVRFPGLVPWITLTIQAQRIILFLTNLIFIFASFSITVPMVLSAIRHKPVRRSIHFSQPAQSQFFWLLFGFIWIASLLQTLLDHGDNPRFLVPLQSLVVLWTAWLLLQRYVFKPQPATTHLDREQ